MSRTPSAVWIVDTNKEHLAVEEARKLRIPIIGILDSNCDPDLVDFPIPGNDDAIRAVGLLTRVVADAVADGLIARSGAKTDDGDGKAIGADEPLADWERELLEGEAEGGRRGGHRWRHRRGGRCHRGDPGCRGHRRGRRGHRGDRGAEQAAERARSRRAGRRGGRRGSAGEAVTEPPPRPAAEPAAEPEPAEQATDTAAETKED